ncbi:DUF5789 family protein [Halococcus thailandensis]|uniref:Uncharacterized protein n=1 Tax=Halococcus thailandensis JCM 13552 TaxID=1227457 RepID=M0ND57_9EURY|nr:DUF5789 family protein [Halococcus thailandensis]EMA54610.1 hypothetical protein C451_06415 [Halococcus thailandensis JCM 13552]
MADDEADEETEEPVVELGEGPSVEGVPLARVTSRLTWGMEHSTVEQRVGDIEIRTPDGPTSLSAVLAEVDEPYFERRQEFEESVREVVGAGPVQTEE